MTLVIRKIVLIQQELSIAIVIAILTVGSATAATTEENEIAARIEKNTYFLAPSEAISKNVTADLDQQAEEVAEKLKISLAAIRTKPNSVQQAPCAAWG